MDRSYYFGCTVKFECVICGRASSEKLVYQASRPDPQRVAGAIAREAFDCQHCGAARTEQTELAINIVPADLNRLYEMGFATTGSIDEPASLAGRFVYFE